MRGRQNRCYGCEQLYRKVTQTNYCSECELKNLKTGVKIKVALILIFILGAVLI